MYWRSQHMWRQVSWRSPQFWVLTGLILLALVGGVYLWVLNGLVRGEESGITAQSATRLTVNVTAHDADTISILVVYLISLLPALLALLLLRRGVVNPRGAWSNLVGIILVVLVLHALVNGIVGTWSVQGRAEAINAWGGQHLKVDNLVQYQARVDGKTATYVLVNGDGQQVAFTIDNALRNGDEYYTYRVVKVPQGIAVDDD